MTFCVSAGARIGGSVNGWPLRARIDDGDAPTHPDLYGRTRAPVHHQPYLVVTTSSLQVRYVLNDVHTSQGLAMQCFWNSISYNTYAEFINRL